MMIDHHDEFDVPFSNSMSHSCPLGHAYETGSGVVSEGSGRV
jgi:hypothetical protein